LKDDKLQQMIQVIDTSTNREEILQILINNYPDFEEFVDKILYLIGFKQ